MFTGIILGKGKIVEKRPAGGGMLFAIQAEFDLPEPEEGESIAVNSAVAGLSSMSRRKAWSAPIWASFPPAAWSTWSGPSGSPTGWAAIWHLVSSHVDATTPVLARKPLGDFVLFSFAVPEGLGKYIIEKGSITIDGISLTVNSVEARAFSVSIIPHTLQVTTLGLLKQGEMVNIEVDLIGKYVEKLLSVKESGEAAQTTRINPAFLAEHGFLK